MSPVVEHLAELTSVRDRTQLDVTLVGALADLLQPLAVAVFRTAGEPDDQRWLLQAQLRRGDIAATGDPLWADLASLPALASQPLRHACLLSDEAATVDGVPAQTLFPLTGVGNSAGVLEIHSSQPLDTEQLRLVSSILRIYRNFHDLLDYSERDTLTGLLNRKTFDDAFLRSTATPFAVRRTLAPAARRCQPQRQAAPAGPWLGIVDIDHFKRVNDGFGHLMGDEVLLLLSRVMRSSFRFHDQLYRFGGEEFVVLMRCACVADAAAAFERLRATVERYVFPRVGGITVSVGFTQVTAADTPTGAFERADKAVYHAKQNGRNQVADHAALVAAGALADATRASDVELF